MKTYKLYRKQFLPISLIQAWEFFSSPKNLAVITPKRLNFKILSMSGGDVVHAGQIIRYKVTVLPLIRVTWETEIIEVVEFKSFTDIQKKGPYSHWSHYHAYAEVNGGIEMTDELEYGMPFGSLGSLANSLFVENEVKKIFDYRYRMLEELFKKS